MTRVTDEQIQEARRISLLEYFQSNNPSCLRHVGGGRYVHKQHDSFVISNGRNNQWYWNSKSVGGVSSIDYLMRIEGMAFVDAVKTLTDGGVSPFSHTARTPPPTVTKPVKPQEPPKTFALPKPAESNDGMIAYLRSRGISESTTRKYINQGLLYESANNTCVFVGRDTQDGNKPKYAAERSITGDGKKDAAGSDKAFSFCLPPDNAGSNAVIVFESGVDALSHHEIMAIAKTERSTTQILADTDGFRLSLAGNASVALVSFLERNPHVQNIYLCLDNDTAGQKATERIIGELLSDSRFSDKNIVIAPPPIGKDYGDTLTGIRQIITERKIHEKYYQRPKNAKTRTSTHIKEMPGIKETRQPQAGFSI